MTEAEWVASADPEAMLTVLGDGIDRRKGLLLAAGFCRRLEELFPDLAWDGPMLTAECDADGLLEEGVRSHMVLWGRGSDPWDRADYVHDAIQTLRIAVAEQSCVQLPFCAELVEHAVAFREPVEVRTAERRRQCGLIRCVFGNPFRPAVFDPAWRTANVLALAQTAYDDRAFAALPILADALADAGCEADLLGHLRGPGPHVRGCWALDLVLGRE